MKLRVSKGDITFASVEAIVNAANNSLLGGGGVDGSIHKAAGIRLLEECKKLNGCETGSAKITPAFNIPAKYIIHAVGPIWRGGKFREVELLENAYKASLNLAIEYNIKTVAFPSISTGAYGFPKILAADIAIKTISDFLENNPSIEKVMYVCYDDENFNIYKEKLGDLSITQIFIHAI